MIKTLFIIEGLLLWQLKREFWYLVPYFTHPFCKSFVTVQVVLAHIAVQGRMKV